MTLVVDFDGTIAKLIVDWPAFKSEAFSMCKNLDMEFTKFSECINFLNQRNLYYDLAFRYECPEGNPTIDLVNRKLVEKIKDENLFYIISNNLTETIRLSLLTIGLNCEPEHILGIDKFKIPKPNSAAGIMLSEEFSVDPLEVLYIGDRNSDFEFSENYGCKFINVKDI